MGEVDRMQGDAISDHVNLASRLESLTKFYDASVIISSATHQGLLDPSEYKIRYLDTVCVKGKEEVIRLFEILDGDPPRTANAEGGNAREPGQSPGVVI